VRINPTLTENVLQETVAKTRKLIVDLYVRCELDYVNGLKIYETIVEKNIFETTKNQINALKLQSVEIVNANKNLTTAPPSEIDANKPIISEPIVSGPTISAPTPTQANIGLLTNPHTNSIISPELLTKPEHA
jgi:hypothetical protein